MPDLSKMRRLVERRGPEPDFPSLDLVADKAQEALQNINIELADLREKRDSIDKAWKDWDIDELLRLGVISRSLAKDAKEEQKKQAEM